MRRLVRTDNRPRLFFICQLFLLHIRVEKVRPYPSCCQSRPEECDDVSDAGDKCSPPSLAVVRHRNIKTKKKKIFKFVRTVPTQLSTTTRGEKTYEINAKWGESKKPPRTASTATSSRLFSYRAAQAEQTAGPLYRKTSRFNVKSRKFCPPKPQRHISIVRAAKHLGCRSYANESVTCHLPCAQRPTPAPRVRPSTKCDILPGDGSIFVCYSRAGLLSPCASRKRHTVRA